MRAMLALGSMALSFGLGGCQVTEDKGNSSTTVEYNADVAGNAVADVANTAQDIGGAIVSDAKREANTFDDKVIDKHDGEPAAEPDHNAQ